MTAIHYFFYQRSWADPGEGPRPPLFLDQTEARMTPLSQGRDDCPTLPPLSEGLDLPLVTALIFWNSCLSAQERSILT